MYDEVNPSQQIEKLDGEQTYLWWVVTILSLPLSKNIYLTFLGILKDFASQIVGAIFSVFKFIGYLLFIILCFFVFPLSALLFKKVHKRMLERLELQRRSRISRRKRISDSA